MSQIATSNKLRGGARKNPLVFTEHGALMAASVLNSKRAVLTSVYVVRAFVQLRRALAAHKELNRKLEELERKTEKLAVSQDAFAAETREQFKQLVTTLRQLMAPPAGKSRPIGFVTPP